MSPHEDTSTRTLRDQSQAHSYDGEDFDLHNVSDSDNDDDDVLPVRARRQRAINPVINPVAQVVNDPDALSSKKSRSTAQDVWHYFQKKDGIAEKTVCQVCKKNRDADPSHWPNTIFEYADGCSTTTLRGHLEREHKADYLKTIKEKGWKNQLPSFLKKQRSEVSVASSSIRPDKFDEQTFLRLLVRFIVVDDQAINLIECQKFHQLLLLLRNDLKDSMIPHRTKLTELVIDSWKQRFQILRRDLAASLGQISFATDIWSDECRRSYLAITAHWIAMIEGTTALQLKASLIAFHRLSGSHDGESFASTVIQLLDRARVTANVGHFTVDNAANNTTMMHALEEKLLEHDIPFDATDRRIMCYAHVVNLCSGRVLRTAGGDGTSESIPIGLARGAVRAMRISGKRREAFDEVVRDGNKKDWFKSGQPPKAVMLKELQLLLREMRPAVDHFLASPQHSELINYRISDDNWTHLQDLELILSIPHKVQQIMSNERLPILAGAIPSFEMFMSKWEQLVQTPEQSHLKDLVQPGLDLAYQYYGRMDRTCAYIIAMLLNPSIRMSWIRKHWDQNYISQAEEQIRQTMREYRGKMSSVTGEPTQTSDLPATKDAPQYMSLAAQYGIADDMEIGESSEDTQTIEQEYQAYITATLSKNVDILKFWEINRSFFPTLYAMAMDYLPIQATAVPCERIFSSSAETDTKQRNHISPLLMEALQMQKFMIKKEHLSFTEGWMTQEEELVEDDPDQDLLQMLLDDDAQTSLDSVIQSINQFSAT